MPSKRYKVGDGEGLGKIANDHGLHWETVWNHGDNQSIRNLRGNPNVLHPGDIVYIPEKETRVVDAATEQRHRFVYDVPAKKEFVRIKLEDTDRSAMANKPYVLTLADGAEHTGKTDSEGMLECEVPFDATGGKLEVDGNEWQLRFGHLNPVDEATDDNNVSGAQSRLNNLGFRCPEDGVLDEGTRAAISEFQREQPDLKETGDLDDATRRALRKRHGD